MAMNDQAGGRGDDLAPLPPGFRFHPTDEEIITHYLTRKVIDSGFTAAAIGEADLNKCEPWDLPSKAKMGEKEWYFFCQKDRKYPTGMRTNRATVSGYWKATGKDKEIHRGKDCLVGMKKTLVFYLGRAPKGEKTNWVMHEFRLEGKVPLYNVHQVAKDEWAVCRVFHKSSEIKQNPNPVSGMPRMNYTEQAEISTNSLPPLVEPSYSAGPAGSSFTDGESEFKAGGTDHMATPSNSSTLINNTTTSPNPNNILSDINYVTAGGYQVNPSPNQPVFNPQVQPNTSVFRAHGPANPSYYYNNQLVGNINIAQCKVEPYNQSMPMIGGPDLYTGLSTNLNPEIPLVSNLKPEPISGSSVPQFEDLIGPLFNSTDSNNGFGFSWDF